MKKIYLAGLMGCIVFANAQSPKPIDAKLPSVPVIKNIKDAEIPSPVRVPQQTSRARFGSMGTAFVTKVGQTMNDRQANASLYKRIFAFPNNKLSVAWMTSSDGPSNNYLGRGTGYNHFDGVGWGTISMNRIESNRAGYPNLDYHPTSNKEYVLSHRIDTGGKSGGLIMLNNLSLGSNIWSSQIVLDTPSVINHPSVLWPRTAISGNYLHVLANYSTPDPARNPTQIDTVIISGVRSPTVYSRYNLTTNTWEAKNITLPGYTGARWFDGSGDGYAIDAVGSTVAVLMGGLGNDWTLWKSNDNGQTWTQRIIDSFPIPAYNSNKPFNDTLVTCDGTVNVKLDATGNAHCFKGRLRIQWNTTTNALGLFLGTNGIDYWYEGRPNTPIATIAGSMDLNNDGTLNIGTINSRTRYGNAGASTMPYAQIDTGGRIFMLYSALTEDDLDGQSGCFRDVYITFSKDNGANWSVSRNLTGFTNFNQEEMFGSVASLIQDKLNITYMISNTQGFYSSADNPTKLGPFDIVHYVIPVKQITDSTVGVYENNTSKDLINIGQNYPNPFSGKTIIPVEVKSAKDITVKISNIVGQEVYSNVFSHIHTGVNHLEVDAASLTSGVYFYTVHVNGESITNKMIVE